MGRSLIFTSIAVAVALSFSYDAIGQRRIRPGSMKHNEQEIVDAFKITKVKGKYIKDGSTFVGDIYLTGDAGGIKIGTVNLVFTNGKYRLSFTNTKFNVQETTSSGRKYWKKQKIGEDFSYDGEYEIIEQMGQYFLKLYETTAAEETADVLKLDGKDADSFEYQDDGMLFRMKYRGY